ncbi:hypothetical protein ACP4OV_003196 [Aristida adscensionis]
MADCYLPEADDLHRRWLPREIFADIGIVDADVDAVATPKAAAAVEDLAAHLTGLLGAKGKGKGKMVSSPLAPPQPTPPPPPPPPLPPVAAPCHGAQACGLEGAVVLAYGGGNAVVGAGAAVAWPFAPYPPVQWQFPSNNVVMNGAAAAVVLDPWFAPAPCLLPPPVMPPAPAPRLGGTGVFLPRVQPHRPPYAAKHPVQDGKFTRAWPGRNQQKEKQENQQKEKQQPGQGQNAAAVHAGPEVAALPQEWCYNN